MNPKRTRRAARMARWRAKGWSAVSRGQRRPPEPEPAPALSPAHRASLAPWLITAVAAWAAVSALLAIGWLR